MVVDKRYEAMNAALPSQAAGDAHRATHMQTHSELAIKAEVRACASLNRPAQPSPLAIVSQRAVYIAWFTDHDHVCTVSNASDREVRVNRPAIDPPDRDEECVVCVEYVVADHLSPWLPNVRNVGHRFSLLLLEFESRKADSVVRVLDARRLPASNAFPSDEVSVCFRV